MRIADHTMSEAVRLALGLAHRGFRGRIAAIERFIVGRRNHASRLVFEKQPGPTAIRAGLSPYFAFDVLYVPAKDQIGLKPRDAVAGFPHGELSEPRN